MYGILGEGWWGLGCDWDGMGWVLGGKGRAGMRDGMVGMLFQELVSHKAPIQEERCVRGVWV